MLYMYINNGNKYIQIDINSAVNGCKFIDDR